jgi:CRISPR-associated protein Csm1
MSLEKEFVIGILCHELGRFKQRACLDEDRGKAPNEIGAGWLENQYGPGLIVDINQGKVGQDLESGRENLIVIAQEAERCATWPAPPDFPELKESTGDLLNIFSLVRNPRLEAPEALPNPTYLPLCPLGDWLEPQLFPDNSLDQYRRHWDQFSQEFLFLREKGAMEPEHCLDVLLHLLEKYLSTIPLIPGEINTGAHPETAVSLFDHVKTAAALGHCLYSFYRNKHPKEWFLRDFTAEIIADETWHAEAEAPFMLVVGDISGIQRFIYTIASTGP